MAIEQIAVAVVEMHAAAEAITEHAAIGALPATGPLAVAERLEPLLPHLPEPVAVDIALVEIGPDGSTPRDGPVDADGSGGDPSGALVKTVADLGLVAAEEPLASVRSVDAPLRTGTAYELQHFAELRVGQTQGRVVLGPAHGEDGEETPRPHPLGDEHVAELGQERDQRPGDAGDDVVSQTGLADDESDGIEGPGIT